MHADTIAALRARLLAEIADDPAGLGYGGLDLPDLAALLNAPVVVEIPAAHRDVLISDVKGYLARRLVIVRLRRQVVANDLTGTVRDVAEALLDILNDTQLTYFLTADATMRAGVLGMFAQLVAAGAGGLTSAHYDDIAAMTLAPAGPPQTTPARWQIVIDGLSAERGHPGPPNAASAELLGDLL
jgi:hypothetical protein